MIATTVFYSYNFQTSSAEMNLRNSQTNKSELNIFFIPRFYTYKVILLQKYLWKYKYIETGPDRIMMKYKGVGGGINLYEKCKMKCLDTLPTNQN